jgi:hypothetical protein
VVFDLVWFLVVVAFFEKKQMAGGVDLQLDLDPIPPFVVFENTSSGRHHPRRIFIHP